MERRKRNHGVILAAKELTVEFLIRIIQLEHPNKFTTLTSELEDIFFTQKARKNDAGEYIAMYIGIYPYLEVVLTVLKDNADFD